MIMLKVIFVALLFLVGLQFPLEKCLTYGLRSRYGNLVVKGLQKFEKIDHSLQKCKLHLTFLIACLDYNIIPKFLNFQVSNLYLKSSRTYHACQIKLLREEILIKKSRIRTLEKDFNYRKKNLEKRYVLLTTLTLYGKTLVIIKIFILINFLTWVWRFQKHDMSQIK